MTEAKETFTGNSVIQYSVTDARIAELESLYRDVPTDLSIKDNYKFVQKGVSELRGLRTDVEKRRKTLKAGALEFGRKVDGEAKRIIDRLLVMEEPMSTAKKNHDAAVEAERRDKAAAEERRIDGIANRIAAIRATVEANISSSSTVLNEAINKVSAEKEGIDGWAMEFAGKAMSTIDDTLQRLNELLTMRQYREEQERKEAEDAEQRRLAEEERKKEEARKMAEEKARLAEEQKKLDEEKKRLAKEEEDRKAEQKRIADEQAARQAELDAKQAAFEEEQKTAREKIAAEQKRIADEQAARQAELDAKQAAFEEEQKRPAEPSTCADVDAPVPAGADPVNQPSVTAPHKSPPEPAAIVNHQPSPMTAAAGRQAAGRQAAGKAMMQIIKNFGVTKTLLDAIIAGAIPNIHFTEN